MKCPGCGAEAWGNFCASCGSPLRMETCPSCGAAAPPGSRFCTSCGRPLTPPRSRGGGKGTGGGPRGAAGGKAPKGPAEGLPRKPAGEAGGGGDPAAAALPQKLGWWVAGALLVVALVALAFPVLRQGDQRQTPEAAPSTSGLIDLTSISLEDQATLLFNRVMTAHSNQDTADVAFFLPKALLIHEELDPQDADGLYHFALLHMVAGDHQAALQKARQGLQGNPDYLLLLAVAAEAYLALGDSSEARAAYQRLLDVYDTEMALMRPGYDHHSRILPTYREEARAFLAGR